MNFDDYIVPANTTIDLSAWDPNHTAGDISEKRAPKLLKEQRKRIRKMQERLYAEGKQSLLICIQAMDTGGKDGTIKSVFKGINQSGVRVRSFKKPNPTEMGHDFLWRYHTHTPRAGFVAIFNRSHYEDVLVVKVKELASPEVIERRYDHINGFERMLEDHGTHILKFYLHISKDEQKRRLESRLEDPRKHWKYSSNDLAERAFWEDYQAAFADMLSRCSTETAPWVIVPANNKWYRDLVVATVIADRLEAMNPQFPDPEPGLEHVSIPD